MAPTKPDTTGHPAAALSVAQQNAVDALAAGMNDAETAAAVGATRQTVNGWRNHDPAFQAALNARRADVWGMAADKLRALVPRAVAVLEQSLTTDADPAVALSVLKLAGVGSRGAALAETGPTSAAAVLDIELVARRDAEDPMMSALCGRPTDDQRQALAAEWAELAALGAGDA